jgi:hypothetical protein
MIILVQNCTLLLGKDTNHSLVLRVGLDGVNNRKTELAFGQVITERFAYGVLKYRVIYNRCKKLCQRVREVILRKKCYINIGAILFIYRTTTDLKLIEINYSSSTLKSSSHGNKQHNL